jgi:uncharacterized membrane protein
MRHFSIRPPLTLKGRTFKGVRGFSGKPTHPPLTDVPITAYVFAATFDAISFIGQRTAWAREFYQAATFVLVAGALVSFATLLTGFFDWWRSYNRKLWMRRCLKGATYPPV